MYLSIKVADKIKETAKSQNISIKKLLEEVGLGFNTMSNMKTSMPKADNLAKIADYLNCSVDYLLGRATQDTDFLTSNEQEIVTIFKQLTEEKQNKVIGFASAQLYEDSYFSKNEKITDFSAPDKNKEKQITT